MSEFIFGKILYTNQLQTMDLRKKAWQVFDVGRKYNLFLVLDNNIVQKDIFRMLEKTTTKLSNLSEISFMITDNPSNDNSGRLFDIGYGIGIDLNLFYNQLSTIQKVINELFLDSAIKIIYLGFVDGYDDNFQNFNINPDDFFVEASKVIYEEYDVNSCMFSITNTKTN